MVDSAGSALLKSAVSSFSPGPTGKPGSSESIPAVNSPDIKKDRR